MAISPVTGARSTLYTGAVLSARKVSDFADGICNPEMGALGKANNEAALFVLLSKINKKREVKNSRYDELEDTFNVREITLSTTVTNTGTSIDYGTANYGYWLMVGSVLFVPSTSERMLVTATSAGSSTVIRNLGAAIIGTSCTGYTEAYGITIEAASDVVWIINETFAEGTSAPNMISTQTQNSYNYTQIEKTVVEVTGTLKETDLYGEANDEKYQIVKKGIEHKLKINRALWTGVRSVRQDSTSGTARRTTGGMLQHIRGNVVDYSGGAWGGTMTTKVIHDFIEKTFENGSGDKTLFTSMFMAHAFDELLMNKLQVGEGASKLGLSCKELITSNGRLTIVVEKKIFYGDLKGYGVCLDMPFIRYAYLRNRDTKFYQNIKDMYHDGYDGNKHAWQTEFGLDVMGYGLDFDSTTAISTTSPFRSVHGLLKGISSY